MRVCLHRCVSERQKKEETQSFYGHKQSKTHASKMFIIVDISAKDSMMHLRCVHHKHTTKSDGARHTGQLDNNCKKCVTVLAISIASLFANAINAICRQSSSQLCSKQ